MNFSAMILPPKSFPGRDAGELSPVFRQGISGEDPDPFVDAGLPVIQGALPFIRRADDHDEAIARRFVPQAICSPPAAGALTRRAQEQSYLRGDLFPCHGAARLPKEDREVRMAAEEELKIGLGEEPLRPPGGARVDRLVE